MMLFKRLFLDNLRGLVATLWPPVLPSDLESLRRRKMLKTMSVARGNAGLLCLILILLTGTAFSQKAYFADGYHGGVYGHYPEWVTQFMVDEFKKHPGWKINLEIEPETWDWARTNTPEAYNAFKALFADPVTNERLEYVNPSYAQSYFWNISGESVIRQFAYGMEKVRGHFPNAQFTTYSSEEPCFTSALPGILKSFGYKYAVLKNPNTCWGGYTRAFGGELVNWIGPDGTAITTVPRYEVETLKPGSAWETIAAENSTNYIQAALKFGISRPVGMCYQDAGWRNGPWLRERTSVYQPSEYVTWREYFGATASLTAPAQDWRLTQEDVQVSLVWGAQALQRIAQQSRAAESRLLMAEKLAAMALVYKASPWPKADFDEAWRTLMLSQHHDCWVVPYNGPRHNTWADKVVQWTDSTKQLSDAVLQKSLDVMSHSSTTNGNVAARVFNTLGAQRSGLAALSLPTDFHAPGATVTDNNSREVPSQMVSLPDGSSKLLLFHAKVPALGYNTYRVKEAGPQQAKAGASALHLSDGTYRLETDFYTILLDPAKGGVFKSLVAKKIGMEFVDKENSRGFNEIRGYFFKDKRFYSTADTPAAVKILENGPLRVRVEVKGTIGIHPVTQVISVVQNQERIDLSVKIDWQGNPGIGADYAQSGGYKGEDDQKAFYDDRYKLLALFPLNLTAQKVYKNAPFDVTESKLTNTLFTTWTDIKNNVILNWVDVANASNSCGMALLTDHATSYAHGSDFPLGLTLQYSGVGLWGRNYTIAGPTEVNYALVPHSGKWDSAQIWTAADQWNEPLVTKAFFSNKAFQEGQKSLINTDGSGFEVSALQIEGNNLVLRLLNAEGDAKPKEISFDGPVERVEWVKLNGELVQTLPIRQDKSGRTIVKIALPRFGFCTLRFSRNTQREH